MKRKGLTLVELLLTLGILSVIVLIGINFLIFSSKGHSVTFDEFNIQSDLRIVSTKINSVIRDASGVFILSRTDNQGLSQEWNYLMLNEDKTKLVDYVWNDEIKDHIPKELAGSSDFSTLELVFKKNNPSNEDKLLEFELTLKKGNKERNIKTEIEAKNALQVVNRSYNKIGNTIAYRYDSRLDSASNAQAVVAMVLDTSASMLRTLNNNSTNVPGNSRLGKMKVEAIRLVEGLSDKPNIWISTVRFGSNANNPHIMLNSKKDLSTIKSNINALSANYSIEPYNNNDLGGTNTGDGIRRGFYRIKEFNEEDRNKNRTNKNFMIILVDGVTTFASVNRREIINDIISFPDDKGETYKYNGYIYKRNESNPFLRKELNSYQGQNYTEGGNEYSYWNTDQKETSFSSNYGDKYTSGGVEYTYVRREGSWIFGYRYIYKYTFYEYRRYNYTYNGIKKEQFVTGNNDIGNVWIKNNSYFAQGGFAGNGIELDESGTLYVDIMGEMVREYKEGTNEAIQVYVIGFSAVPSDHKSLKDIAMSTRGDTVYYEAGDSEALEAIFKSIQRDISDALWHIGGPN